MSRTLNMFSRPNWSILALEPISNIIPSSHQNLYSPATSSLGYQSSSSSSPYSPLWSNYYPRYYFESVIHPESDTVPPRSIVGLYKPASFYHNSLHHHHHSAHSSHFKSGAAGGGSGGAPIYPYKDSSDKRKPSGIYTDSPAFSQQAKDDIVKAATEDGKAGPNLKVCMCEF